MAIVLTLLAVAGSCFLAVKTYGAQGTDVNIPLADAPTMGAACSSANYRSVVTIRETGDMFACVSDVWAPLRRTHATDCTTFTCDNELAPSSACWEEDDDALYVCDGPTSTWIEAGGAGFVKGPATATDTAVSLYDLTTGKLLKDSGVLVSATNDVTIPGDIIEGGAAANARLNVKAVGSSINPADLAGLELWIVGDDGVTDFGYLDGGQVSQVNDRSTQHNDYAAFAGSTPEYRTSVLNGHDAYGPTDGDRLEACASNGCNALAGGPVLDGEITMFIVYEPPTDTGGSFMIGLNDGDRTTTHGVYFPGVHASAQAFLYFPIAGGVALSPVFDNTGHVYNVGIVRRDSSNNIYYYHANPSTTLVERSNGLTNSERLYVRSLFQANTSGLFHAGTGSHLFELIVYKGDLTTAEREEVYNYLATKYSFPLVSSPSTARDAMQWETETAAYGVIDPSGHIGLGTTTPSSSADGAANELVIAGPNVGLSLIDSGTTGTGSIYFGDSADPNEGRLTYTHTDDIVHLWAGSVEVARFDNATGLSLGNGTIGDLDLQFLDDDGPGAHYLRWDDSPGEFDFSNSINVTGSATLLGATVNGQEVEHHVHATDCPGNFTCDADAAGEVCFEEDDDVLYVCDGPVTTWEASAAGGDVTGPASSTDNAIARFDGPGGKTLQDSGALVSDAGHILLETDDDFDESIVIKDTNTTFNAGVNSVVTGNDQFDATVWVCGSRPSGFGEDLFYCGVEDGVGGLDGGVAVTGDTGSRSITFGAGGPGTTNYFAATETLGGSVTVGGSDVTLHDGTDTDWTATVNLASPDESFGWDESEDRFFFSDGLEVTAYTEGGVTLCKSDGTDCAAGAEVNDLSSVVTWANVPDANITSSSVTQHIDTFAKLQTAVADKTLINEEDAVALDSTLDVAGATEIDVDSADALQVRNSVDTGLVLDVNTGTLTTRGGVGINAEADPGASVLVVSSSTGASARISLGGPPKSDGARTIRNSRMGGFSADQRPAVSGTATAGSSGLVLEDTGLTMSLNEYAGRFIENTTDTNPGLSTGSHGTIASNTACPGTCTITVSSLNLGTDNDFDSGDAYTIQGDEEDYSLMLASSAGGSNTISYGCGSTVENCATAIAFATMPINYIRGSTRWDAMKIWTNGQISMGRTLDGTATIHSPLGNLHVKAPVASQEPVAVLETLDTNEPFLDFRGLEEANAIRNLSSWTGGNSIQGFARHAINGTDYWLPWYDAPTDADATCGSCSINPPSGALSTTQTASCGSQTGIVNNDVLTWSPQSDWDDDVIPKYCRGSGVDTITCTFYYDAAGSADPLDPGAQTINWCVTR